jgi:hypothetical protein
MGICAVVQLVVKLVGRTGLEGLAEIKLGLLGINPDY